MIKIICVGKIKEKYLKDAMEEYSKRISKYTKLEIIEVPDEANGDILFKEQEKIKRYINDKDYLVTLEIDGKQLTSPELANKINNTFIGYPNITFIIGGSYGIHEEIKKISNYSLSFSKMTFPHQLFRVLLLEQIYRAYKIMNNESYHK